LAASLAALAWRTFSSVFTLSIRVVSKTKQPSSLGSSSISWPGFTKRSPTFRAIDVKPSALAFTTLIFVGVMHILMHFGVMPQHVAAKAKEALDKAKGSAAGTP